MTSQERYALLAALMPLTDPQVNQGDTNSDTEFRVRYGKRLAYFLRLTKENFQTYPTSAGGKSEVGIASLVLDLLVNTLARDNEGED